jgi:hypothetical protein
VHAFRGAADAQFPAQGVQQAQMPQGEPVLERTHGFPHSNGVNIDPDKHRLPRKGCPFGYQDCTSSIIDPLQSIFERKIAIPTPEY